MPSLHVFLIWKIGPWLHLNRGVRSPRFWCCSPLYPTDQSDLVLSIGQITPHACLKASASNCRSETESGRSIKRWWPQQRTVSHTGSILRGMDSDTSFQADAIPVPGHCPGPRQGPQVFSPETKDFAKWTNYPRLAEQEHGPALDGSDLILVKVIS